MLDIFQNHVFGFANVPSDRRTIKYLPIQIETTKWRKKAVVADNLTLDVELLRGKGDPGKPTQIVNKNFAIWAKEFDMVLNMGKAATHRFHEGSHVGIMMEEVAFLQTSTLQVIDTLINFFSDTFVAGIQKVWGRLESLK